MGIIKDFIENFELFETSAKDDKYIPDYDICSSCGEHAEFGEDEDESYVSNCCGASVVNSDPDIDMER